MLFAEGSGSLPLWGKTETHRKLLQKQVMCRGKSVPPRLFFSTYSSSASPPGLVGETNTSQTVLCGERAVLEQHGTKITFFSPHNIFYFPVCKSRRRADKAGSTESRIRAGWGAPLLSTASSRAQGSYS